MNHTNEIWYRGGRHREVTTVYENEWFKIRNRDNYYSLEYCFPQVVILPLVNDRILMVKVKRPLIDDEPLELPAGGCCLNETPKKTARRELKEETGIWINCLNRFKALTPISEIPGRSPELLLSFMVRITTKEFENRGDKESEIVEIKLMSYYELKQAIISGELYLSSTMAIISRHLFELETNRTN